MASRAVRRGVSIGVILLVIVLTVATLLIARSFQTPAQKAASASAPPPSVVTEEVTDQVLRSTTPVTCSPGRSGVVDLKASVQGQEGGDPQYTSVDVQRDERLDDGSLVASVNGRPLLVLIGGFSLYRDLHLKDRGPDAALLNDALASMGRQAARIGEDRETITAQTYTALRSLYAAYGYEGPKDDATIRSADFIVLPEPATVITAPRGTGAVSQGPLAQVSSQEVTLSCAGTGGDLTPEVRTGQHIIIPAWSQTPYEITVTEADSTQKGTGSSEESDGTGQSTAQSSGESAGESAGGTQGGSTSEQGGTSGGKRTATIPVDEKHRANLPSSLAGQLILSSSEGRQPVVPSAALWTSGGTTRVTVVEKGDHRRDVPVTVVFTADGMSAVTPVEGSLKAGDQVLVLGRSEAGDAGESGSAAGTGS